MITIDRHTLPDEESCDWYATDAFETMEKIPPSYPRSIYMYIDIGYQGACGAAAISPDDPRILEGFQYAAQAAAGGFQMACTTTGSVSFPFRDLTITLSGIGPHDGLNPISWTRGVFAAVIARDTNSLAILCQPEIFFAAQSAPIQMDPFVVPYARAVLAWAKNQDPLPHINEARTVLPNEGRPHFVIRTLLELIEVEGQGLYPELDGILGEALAGHRHYYSQGDNPSEYLGWLAPGPLAVACRAADRGFRSKIRSPYIPQILVLPDAD